jgi:O-antigen biosynthesis protein
VDRTRLLVEFLMAFDALKIPITFAPPAYLAPVSAWVTHIPFAFTLTALARPRVLVELGTHYGVSYLAFCQAVKALGLPTRCTAVDTWTGDAHSGFYGEEVLAKVRENHDPHYSGFSRLLQMEFDTAVKLFEAGTIDLLHIDGLHTYEAVLHDYETWLPKLSPQAVVLLHDTAVVERDFGVHRLYAELAVKHPAFAFAHGNGLGVVAPGGDPPEAVVEFLEFAAANPAETENCYAALGERVYLARMLLSMLMLSAETQRSINSARRWLNLSVDPATDKIETAMQRPLEFLAHQHRTLVELLAGVGVGPAQKAK